MRPRMPAHHAPHAHGKSSANRPGSTAARHITHHKSRHGAVTPLPCSWQGARGASCCARHPVACRDTSHLKLAPPPDSARCPHDACCAGTPAYLRAGKTGSTNLTLFLASKVAAGCAQSHLFHDVLASSLPPHQNKLAVLREPCNRAGSLLRHWQRNFPPSHPVQRVHGLPQLADFLELNWRNITRRPWPEASAALHHFIVGWPQVPPPPSRAAPLAHHTMLARRGTSTSARAPCASSGWRRTSAASAALTGAARCRRQRSAPCCRRMATQPLRAHGSASCTPTIGSCSSAFARARRRGASTSPASACALLRHRSSAIHSC